MSTDWYERKAVAYLDGLDAAIAGGRLTRRVLEQLFGDFLALTEAAPPERTFVPIFP